MCARHLTKINSLNSLQKNLNRYCCCLHFTDKKAEEERHGDITGRPLEHWPVGKLATIENS